MPEVRLYHPLHWTVEAQNSTFEMKATHNEITSSITVTLDEDAAFPTSCSLSVPLYRSNELSSIYTLQLPMHSTRSPTPGKHYKAIAQPTANSSV